MNKHPAPVDLSVFDTRHLDQPGRVQRCVKVARDHVRQHKSGGKFLEIGAQHNQVARYFPDFEYMTLDLRKTADNVIVADICDCPQIVSGSFAVVFSIDVFEHIRKPWLAAQEIERILEPGGVVFVSTVFSWRYHPSPVDFWRFSPDALESLFPSCETLAKTWDFIERRRNNLKDGALEPIDELGGWRENVRVNYVGRRREAALTSLT